MSRIYGYMEDPEDRGAVCPECGRACYKIYRHDGEIVGCDECVTEEDACDASECFRDGRDL